MEVYFNRPSRPFPVRYLCEDIVACEGRLAIASAWFTDTDIAAAIIDSPAVEKVVFLNQSDLDRSNRKAVGMLQKYFADDPDQWYASLVMLGSHDWAEGVMHHKFVLTSDCVWVGSYNLTFQARNNYETILRIEDEDVLDQFWKEVRSLRDDDIIYTLRPGCGAPRQRIFRCLTCEQLKSIAEAVRPDMCYQWQCQACRASER